MFESCSGRPRPQPGCRRGGGQGDWRADRARPARATIARLPAPGPGEGAGGGAASDDEHLEAGRVSEWRATLVCRETACLSAPDRARVDAALGPRLPDMGDLEVARAARTMACELDGAAMARRAAQADSERRVSVRPAPDTMTYLSALLRSRREWRHRPRSTLTPRVCWPPATRAAQARSWPIPWWSGSPVRRAPRRCRWRSGALRVRPPARHPPRPDLPDTLVRCTDPPPRPCGALQRRRTDGGLQRRWHV
jgi:hypothetical protein